MIDIESIGCTACAEANESGGDMCRDHAEEAVLDQVAAESEARGYARGVEDAAKVVDDMCSDHIDAVGVCTAIHALLKPKGEAK